MAADNALPLVGSETLVPAIVVSIDARRLTVRDANDRIHEADLLYTSDNSPLTLAPGDTVLLLLDPQRGALILGRVGASGSLHAPAREEATDELTLEAKSCLTLKCGDGSITLRQDGKILIKGKNLVSLAMETNRIKGGSVSIN